MRLSRHGYAVDAFSAGPDPMHADVSANWHGIEMEREISPIRDLASIVQIWRLMRRLRPQIVNVGTPKAGLLGGLAATLAGVPCRTYTLHGLRLETATGWKRRLLTITERISCKSAHRVLCVSNSLRDRAVELGIVSPDKIVVPANGTADGIAIERFRPTAETASCARRLRCDLQIPDSAPVIGFVGRFTRDKGIAELYSAFGALRQRYPELRLLLVGEFEEGDPVSAELRQQIESDTKIVRPGFVADAAAYYHLMDVLVLPTYREGFPNVPLEAQAAGIPVVTTTATGAIESVIPGQTGLLVPVGDSNALADAVGRLLEDDSLRRQMGRAGQEWVAREFQPEKVWQAVLNEYEQLLAAHRNKQTLRQRGWRRLVKSTVDRVLAAGALVVLSPVLLVCALLVAFGVGRPILFRQRRPGFRGRPFTLVKFRTMSTATDAEGNLLSDEQRLTRVGRMLRSLSLDELPQLWNVLRGDMSLVGPRPLLMQYLERYTPEQARRHDVLPGITGWTQVNGRNRLSWEEKFEFDLWYVDYWSLSLDLKILFKTLLQVIKRSGITQEGYASMPEFLGSEHLSVANDAS
jgi:lipopolysaccharide/colanic/teichoic acid biosynthesis glycosyltransferase